MKITICRRSHFNAAHKLYNKSWSKEKNLEVFGKCSYENYHGHNYELIVKLYGEINEEKNLQNEISHEFQWEQPCNLNLLIQPIIILLANLILLFYIK